MKSVVLLCVLAFVPAFNSLQGHELHYDVTDGKAVVVRFSLPDDSAFSNQPYQLFHEGDDIPFQAGKTDEFGRVVFIPDRSGTWRVNTHSIDGHGLEITFSTDEDFLVSEVNRTLFDRYSRLLVGIGLIFGIFGAFNLFHRKRVS